MPKRDYKRLHQEMVKINKNLLIDLFASLYDARTLSEDFKNTIYGDINGQNFLQFMGHFIKIITHKEKNWENILNKAISRNENYIESFGYQKLSHQEIKEVFDMDRSPAWHSESVTPDMMLAYYFGKNIFQGEDVEFYTECYNEFCAKVNAQKPMSVAEADNILEKSFNDFELNAFSNENNINNLDSIDWIAIANKFGCQYSSETKTYSNVQRSLLFFLSVKLNEIVEFKKNVISKTSTILAFANKANAFANKQMIFLKELFALRTENNNLKTKIKRLIRQLKELEKTKQTVKKESNTDKDKQIIELTKQNNFLLSRIESLESQISLLEESKQINETIQENIEIEEKVVEITPPTFEYQDICVLGGSWNSKTKEELQKALPTCNIEFIETEKTLSKIDRIANADIVIFDTSRNAHGYYYKVKQYANKLLHINKSKAEEIIRLAEK